MAKDWNLKWRGKEVFIEATKVNIRAMTKAALIVERDVKKNFTKKGSGASRRKTLTGKRHKASLAGQPPAVDTGILRASIMHQIKVKAGSVNGMVGVDIEKLAALSSAGTDVEYGLYLEVGTSKMAARPYLRPALKRKSRTIKRIFDKANG